MRGFFFVALVVAFFFVFRQTQDARRVVVVEDFGVAAPDDGLFEDAFDKHALSFVAPVAGHPGYLARTDGPCVFCDNRHWKFPLGCPYGKPKETPLPNGWLEKVAAQILSSGTSARAALAAPVTGHMLDDGFEARRTPPPYIP